MFPHLANENTSNTPHASSYDPSLNTRTTSKQPTPGMFSQTPSGSRTNPVPEHDQRVPSVNEYLSPGQDVAATQSQQKLPYGIFLACQHFLENPRVTQRMCKGCENRGNVVHTFWNKQRKSWQTIRPRPANVRRFCLCRNYASTGQKCFNGQACTFAHGHEELYIWSMDQKKGE